ncbi:CRISPR locus-related DNA-binding protein [Candidatus Micrarchaeota archaeon]|nr:CRISPR locus-related DNA-binding protein [Candidatus Micrarchaeota archaeon]
MSEDKKVLIATFYSIEPVIPSIHRFSPDKLVLITSDKPDETVKKNIQSIKRMFSTVMKIEVVYIKQYDIYRIAKATVGLIEKEHEKSSQIYVNITGARKTLMLGVIYGVYARDDMVTSIHYSTEENNEFIELPKMSYDLNEMERMILEMISKDGKINVNKAAEKFGKTRGLLYLYLKKLRMKGFLDNNFNITSAGRISLL